MQNTTVNLTEILTNRIMSIRYDAVPADVCEIAKHCLLDWLGVGVAGRDEPAVSLLVAEASDMGALGGKGGWIFDGKTARADWGSLINGTAAHALDFDDVSMDFIGHPSVSVFAALLAWIYRGDNPCSGKDLISAFVAGVEAECIIGKLITPSHYAKGFHATGTLGTIAAAVACSKLGNFDKQQTLRAIDLAATQAAGLKCMFGTMAKPLHAGLAARNGLVAASLAQRGFTSCLDALENVEGFLAAESDAPKWDLLHEELSVWHTRSILFKYYPSCYFTHAAIRGLTELSREVDVHLDEIRGVELRVPEAHMTVCNIQNPKTPLEMKFSVRILAAMALSGLPVRSDTLTAAVAEKLSASDIYKNISIVPEPRRQNVFSTGIVIHKTDGSHIDKEVDVSVPNGVDALPDQWTSLLEKNRPLLQARFGDVDTDAIVRSIGRFDELADVRVAMDVFARQRKAPSRLSAEA